MNSGIFVFGNDNLMVSYNRIGNIFKNRVLVCLERHIRVRLCKLPCQRYVRLIFLNGVGHVCFKEDFRQSEIQGRRLKLFSAGIRHHQRQLAARQIFLRSTAAVLTEQLDFARFLVGDAAAAQRLLR